MQKPNSINIFAETSQWEITSVMKRWRHGKTPVFLRFRIPVPAIILQRSSAFNPASAWRSEAERNTDIASLSVHLSVTRWYCVTINSRVTKGPSDVCRLKFCNCTSVRIITFEKAWVNGLIIHSKSSKMALFDIKGRFFYCNSFSH